eukprot:c23651_g1_i1 orf=1-150(-)
MLAILGLKEDRGTIISLGKQIVFFSLLSSECKQKTMQFMHGSHSSIGVRG